MKLKGFDEFEKVIQGLKNDFPDSTETFMKQQAEALKADVKKATPVDTGTLRNAWQRENAGKYRQVLFNATDYAAHVEYGHRIGKGRKRFVKGRFMLRKAVDKRRIKFYRDLETFVGKLMKK
ncbi:HK97 gp10 family phage protein [Fusobacterium necrophorum]|uniref:HK97 gp10 family phage protein n=1 Tax=Fusobacterium necrophorum TaxID=859 RepID=UPI0001BC58E9